MIVDVSDTDILNGANWMEEIDISGDSDYEWLEEPDMPNQYCDYCSDFSMISTKDDEWNIDGCMIADEADKLDIYTANMVQNPITQEEYVRQLLKEQESDEQVRDKHAEEEEEEMDPPSKSDALPRPSKHSRCAV